MTDYSERMADYVDVAERITEFRTKHPKGSLQSEVLRWPSPDCAFVAVKAYAYRDPSDPRPGVGVAWENVPGKTPYTKDSELQNAETSAWGRAIVAVLAADTKRGVASKQEVERSVGAGSGPATRPAPAKRSPESSPAGEPESGSVREVDGAIASLAERLGWSPSKVLSFARKNCGLRATKADTKTWSEEEATVVEAALMNEVGE